MSRGQTLTGAKGSADVPELGVVSGYLFKLMRGAIGCTQVDLAERLGVDDNTIQGWESGRRPLSALRAVDVSRLGQRMMMLGAPAVATAMLPSAIEADGFLTTAIRAGSAEIPLWENPLASSVHRRSFVSLVTWPFTGVVPSTVRHLPVPRGRGPVADRPQLSKTMQRQFFDQMLTSAEVAGNRETLLRRQATYMLAFDERKESAQWLTREHRRTAARSIDERDLPSGILSRTASLAIARQGDLDPVRHFIQGTLSDNDQTLASLTYWAYWLGEIPDTYADDGEMVQFGANTWSGRRLIEHLITHLHDPRNAEMNIHSLLCLVMARKELLESDSDLRQRTMLAIESADTAELGRHARTELANLRFATQLAGR
ncbi:helix-turn-helix domain-containing protein [Kribbella jiaozuonensis]|uniref:Helix-turn-helix transcriptional regulator n=1 Tax=Kribbella jiaozuonensis TaxID=2575441 RepID=A0A4U3LEZ0_9ACTN|nr:helix-turn-helix transcriptional regulator [Kribbella jiaozuonensis]TKK74075.1 helix-turn-helix transcriptional regulator [Kribbella jiaozuonensis]